MRANHDAVADLIPVDVVINLTLSAGWYTAVHRSERPLEAPQQRTSLTVSWFRVVEGIMEWKMVTQR